MHDIVGTIHKTLADATSPMIRYRSQHQLTIEEFRTPFELKLSRENRWVKLAEALPWDSLVSIYCRTLSKKQGRPVVNPRIVIGALIIKHKEGLSDEDTIQAIQENIYHQYFLGLHQYQYAPVFDPSLFVTIRKRIGVDTFNAMVLELMRIATELPLASREHPHETLPPSSSTAADAHEQNASPQVTPSPSDAPSDNLPNAGTLIVDMTVAPADIVYPTDMELLNAAREHTEALIDTLYTTSPGTLKPRTYRWNARKEYLAFAKQRKKKPENTTQSAAQATWLCWTQHQNDSHIARHPALRDGVLVVHSDTNVLDCARTLSSTASDV